MLIHCHLGFIKLTTNFKLWSASVAENYDTCALYCTWKCNSCNRFKYPLQIIGVYQSPRTVLGRSYYQLLRSDKFLIDSTRGHTSVLMIWIKAIVNTLLNLWAVWLSNLCLSQLSGRDANVSGYSEITWYAHRSDTLRLFASGRRRLPDRSVTFLLYVIYRYGPFEPHKKSCYHITVTWPKLSVRFSHANWNGSPFSYIPHDVSTNFHDDICYPYR